MTGTVRVVSGFGYLPLWMVASVACSAAGGAAPVANENEGSGDPPPSVASTSAAAPNGTADADSVPPQVPSSGALAGREDEAAGSAGVVPPNASGALDPAGAGGGGGATDAPGDVGSSGSATGGLLRGPDPSVATATEEGSFAVESYREGLRDGPDYGTQTLYYPADAEPPFAGVVVVPGFLSPESSTAAWGPFLASHGIVTLTIGTNGPGDLPDLRARALLDGIETIKAEHARPGSPLEGRIALDRFGIMGWSMGGGGTLIAANDTPELKAAVTLAAWSPGASFGNIEVPTLLFAGTADTLAGGQSQGFYASIPESTPKMLYEVAGGSHSVANTPAGAGGEVGRYGLSWMKVFLEGDERYRQFLLQPPTREADFFADL